ncbi:MAG: hypothetical protein ACREIW_10160 [Chthoniobacterales bacterium]
MKLLPVSLAICLCSFHASLLRAQEDDASDLTKMLKDAQELQQQAAEIQKQNPTSPDTRKKLAEMEADAKAEAARQEKEEDLENQKLQAALKQQFDAPGKVSLPDWTPATPQLKVAGAAVKKIVGDEVRVIQTGTTSLAPKEVADSWEAAATAASNLNRGRNNISSNGTITTIMFLSTRTDPVQEVKMEAKRAPDEKVTQITISSPLPKPVIEGE